MPKTCARCGTMAGRGRGMALPGDWLSYLRAERDLSAPVGRLSMPLCRSCHGEVEAIRDGGDERADERDELLDGLDLDALVDEGA